jgi:hypothetical protein
MHVSNGDVMPGPHAAAGQVVPLGWQIRSWVATIPEGSALGEGPMHWLGGTDTLTGPMPQEGPPKLLLKPLQLVFGGLYAAPSSSHELPKVVGIWIWVQFAFAWQSVPQLHAVPGLAFSTTSTVPKPDGQDAEVEEANATSDQLAGAWSVQLPQLVSGCAVSTAAESITATVVSVAEESATVESIVAESTTDESAMVESRRDESSSEASMSREGASSTDESPAGPEESAVTAEQSSSVSAESVAPVAASVPGTIIAASWAACPSTPLGPV